VQAKFREIGYGTLMSAPATRTARSSASEPNKGRRTANRILDVAEDLFAQNGYEATSLRDIATQAGLQQPGLYKHFASKEDLYRQVYERALRPMTDLMDQLLAAPDGGFDELTDRMTDLLAEHPTIARLLVRAVISSDSQPDLVALDWLGRVVGYGRKLSEKAQEAPSGSLLAVQIVAIFNMLFGFFWASPLLESLTGKPATDPDGMAFQKNLLRQFIASLSQTP
jgi:AcrR family transcriptional regulator